MSKYQEIKIELIDEEWPFTYTDHDRNIVRGIVFDDEGRFYFVRADRDDDFGRAIVIETAGGGVEDGEDLGEAIHRELREELGAEVEVVCRIGVVSDYYNLIHRHNINNYYLCRAISFGERSLTEDEIERYHLSTLTMTYDEAISEYERRKDSRLGRILANRELPILRRAKEIIDNIKEEKMTINEYQSLAMRTVNQDLDKNQMLINSVMGLCGESGEAIDIVKKWYAHGHELDREHLKKELGDIAWYLAEAATALDIKLEDVLYANIEKLRARYPEGFDTKKSVNREEKDI